MKKNRKEQRAYRPKGRARSQIVVMTDSTFERHKILNEFWWIGKCIHCNTKVVVSSDGSTDATIEHIDPLCNGGDPTDPKGLALACSGCNNEKGIRHDKHAGKGGRADEVIAALKAKRLSRWREELTW